MLGYYIEAWGVDNWKFMGIGSLLRGARLHDVFTDPEKAKDDATLFRTISNEVLPRIMKKSPFYLFLFSFETHQPFLKCQQNCKVEHMESYHRCFTCFETNVKMVIEAVRKLGLENNTEVLIYGDHVVRFQADWLGKSRKLIILLPFHKPKEVVKQMTYYDVLPTVLDLLDIETSQVPPWGVTMNSDKVGSFPTDEELSFLTGWLWDRNMTRIMGGKPVEKSLYPTLELDRHQRRK
jgi:phosphoglycerol transferase MdoB-like AlkP superfamily enzyme